MDAKEIALRAYITQLRTALREIVDIPDRLDDPLDSDPGATIAEMQMEANNALQLKQP